MEGLCAGARVRATRSLPILVALASEGLGRTRTGATRTPVLINQRVPQTPSRRPTPDMTMPAFVTVDVGQAHSSTRILSMSEPPRVS